MIEGTRFSRRRVLAAGSIALAGLAGCIDAIDSDDDDDGNENGDEDEDSDTTDGQEGEPPENPLPDPLPDDPGPEDFEDRTGEAVVEVITRRGGEEEPAFVFDPPFVTVDQGTSVRWVNADGVFHTVTSTPSLSNRSGGGETFDVTIASEGDTFEREFEESGRQDYYCSPHAGFMFGAIEIE